jgi:hypothetical protein
MRQYWTLAILCVLQTKRTLDALPGWPKSVFNLKVNDPELSVREWAVNEGAIGKETSIRAEIHEEVLSISN